jgi:GR25 family glycosyltransferase involved in LPS biosynthesis
MKSFIIHLSKISSSLQGALRVKEKLDEFKIQNELFEGSYGITIMEEYRKQGRIAHSWGLKGPTLPFSKIQQEELFRPGIIGCFDSHYRLWQKCVELNEPILIFEDDVIIDRPYIPVNWTDILIVAYSHAKKFPNYQHFLYNPTGTPEAVWYKQNTMPGTAGYAIHPHSAKKLIDTFKNSFLPADNAIHKALVEIQAHNYAMGRSLTKEEGNISLVASDKVWKTINV